MNCGRILRRATILLFVLGSVRCYDVYYRPQDEKNIRRQFRVQADVSFLSFDSNPKTAGFFGREGLSISAVFQFDDRQFIDYIGLIEDESAWQPVPFAGYSPKRADDYSDSALKWFDLPIPSWIETRLQHRPHLEDVLEIAHGRYHCLVITVQPGEGTKRNPAASHWHYQGRSCCEPPDASPVILTFGVLDLDTQRLYAYISFGA